MLVSGAHAQGLPWDTSQLTGVVDDASGGGTARTRVDAEATAFIPNGTPIAITGPADAAGYVPVTWAGGSGFIPASQVAAVADSYLPSASDPGMYLPSQGAGDRTVTLDIDASGQVTRVGTLGQARTAGANTSLLGVQGGDTNVGLAPEPQAPVTGGQAAPAPGSAWQTGIIATAEEATRGAAGALGVSAIYVALPSRKALGKNVQLQLNDAQGAGLGNALSAPVKDVGPWRTNDAYWESGARPYAEALKGKKVKWVKGQGYMASTTGRRCNGAGIDISTQLWTKLKPGLSRRQARNMTGSVNWSFGEAARVD